VTTSTADRLGDRGSLQATLGPAADEAPIITVSHFLALSADDKLRVYADLERAADMRQVDPKLRADILRCADEALADGRLAEAEAEAIRCQLDEAHPGAVLEQWWRKLVKNRPSIGAFPRRTTPTVPTAGEWLKDNPQRLAGVVREMRRFSDDVPKIVNSVLELADRAAIDAELADRIVCGALRPKGARRVG